MSEKEHPAALAGRYLRAAGVAIQKELERRSAEAGQTSAEEAEGQATAAPQAQAAAAQQAVSGQAAPGQAARRRARPPKPPLQPRPILDRVLWLVFVLALLALVLTGLQVQMLASGSTETGVRLGLGIPILVAAILVLTNWGRANERLVTRVFRIWGLEQPTTGGGRFARGLVKNGLTLLGIVLLATAAFQLMSALVA